MGSPSKSMGSLHPNQWELFIQNRESSSSKSMSSYGPGVLFLQYWFDKFHLPTPLFGSGFLCYSSLHHSSKLLALSSRKPLGLQVWTSSLLQSLIPFSVLFIQIRHIHSIVQYKFHLQNSHCRSCTRSKIYYSLRFL